jgi:hypothetical protein
MNLYCYDAEGRELRNLRGDQGGNSGAGEDGAFPHGHEYFLSLESIDQPGNSELLELPMTILPSQDSPLLQGLRSRAGGHSARLLNRLRPELRWLRPDGRNLKQMLSVLDEALADQRPYVEFMLHSSEFMPGGSPTFTSERSIEDLYEQLVKLFAAASDRFKGMTLSEYRQSRYGMSAV